MSENIKVLLADDHAIVLEGIRAVLTTDAQISVVAEANNGQEVLELLENTEIDVAVLDINMPKMDGLTCARAIKAKFPNIKVLILTMYSQYSFVEQIFKIGIDGCLLKNNTGSELVSAIHRVASGRSYFDLIHDFNSNTNDIAQYRLGPREVEILQLLVEGKSNSQIADTLNISESTAKTHRKNIMRKTGIHNATQLVQFAITNQLISKPKD